MVCQKFIFLLFLAAFIVSCGSQPNKLARDWSKIDLQEQRVRAIKAASESLSVINNPQVLVQISRQDLSDLLVPALQERLTDLKIKNTDSFLISSFKLSLGQQLIQLSAKFSMDITEPDFLLEGNLSMVGAVAMQANQLVVYPVLNSLKLEGVDRSEVDMRWSDINNPGYFLEKAKLKFDKKMTSKIAGDIFESTMKTINQEAFRHPVAIDLDLDAIKGLDLEKMVNQGEKEKAEYSLITPEKQSVSALKLGDSAIHISAERLSMIAEIEVQGSTQPSQLKKFVDESPGSQLAGFSYGNFSSQYNSLIKEHFDAVGQGSSIQIRKNLIAAVLNEALLTINQQHDDAGLFMLAASHEPVSDTMTENLRLWKHNQVSCQDLRKSCEHTKSCVAEPCQKKSCAKDCGAFNLSCKAKVELCRSKEEADFQACSLARKSEVEACQTAARDAEKGCRLKQDREIATCNKQLESLGKVDGYLNVATYTMDAGAGISRGNTIIKEVRLSEELETVQVKAMLTMTAPVYATVHISPGNAENLACVWQSNPSVTATASGGHPIDIETAITAKEEKGQLVMQAALKSEPTLLTVEPSPWSQLVSNPDFLLNCFLLDIPMKPVAIADFINLDSVESGLGRLVHGKFEFKGLDVTINQSIGPLQLRTQHASKVYQPTWGDKSIGFAQ